MTQKKFPGWFPFAVVSSFLVMIAAGMKSNWTLAADRKPEPPPPDPTKPPTSPAITQAGVLKDWASGDYRV
jgi:hypothetical protein